MNELGRALRAWRERTDPATAGLARTTPARTPGLRREELAVAAGISVEYVVRLEQGRMATPSAQVCLSLARALQLTDDERAHLMRLAGHPVVHRRVPRLIPHSVHRILERLDAQPLSVYDATWNLLHWNRLFAAVFGDPEQLPAERRNLLLMQFGNDHDHDRSRIRLPDQAAFEASLVADLRSASGRFPDDPELAALLARLNTLPRFADLWSSGSVAEHRSGRKTVLHPEVGEIELDSETLTTDGTHLHIVIYTPRPRTDARNKLDLLATLGTQRFTTPSP